MSYTYLRDEVRNGIDCAVIGISYTVFHKLTAVPRTTRTYPVRIAGTSSQTLWWDKAAGRELAYTETFDFLFTLATGDEVEYVGESSGELIEAKPLDRAAAAAAIRDELERQKVEGASVRSDELGVTITLENVNFQPNSDALLPAEQEKLRRIAAILANYPDRDIAVTGHTAGVPATPRQQHQELSELRAKAVGDFLLSLGARSAGQITTRGMGAGVPHRRQRDRGRPPEEPPGGDHDPGELSRRAARPCAAVVRLYLPVRGRPRAFHGSGRPPAFPGLRRSRSPRRPSPGARRAAAGGRTAPRRRARAPARRRAPGPRPSARTGPAPGGARSRRRSPAAPWRPRPRGPTPRRRRSGLIPRARNHASARRRDRPVAVRIIGTRAQGIGDRAVSARRLAGDGRRREQQRRHRDRCGRRGPGASDGGPGGHGHVREPLLHPLDARARVAGLEAQVHAGVPPRGTSGDQAGEHGVGGGHRAVHRELAPQGLAGVRERRAEALPAVEQLPGVAPQRASRRRSAPPPRVSRTNRRSPTSSSSRRMVRLSAEGLRFTSRPGPAEVEGRRRRRGTRADRAGPWRAPVAYSRNSIWRKYHFHQ